MNIENKFLGGRVVEFKEEDRNGIPIGIIEGYIATWDIDRGDFWGTRDQFVKGAFLKSIEEHRAKSRPIRFKDHHGRTIGGFPIDSVREDEIGLFGRAEVNLQVQQGREAYMLAKQGVLSEFSIGFSVDDASIDEKDNLRTIHKATIWEGSIVDEPMNPAARVTSVKSAVPFQDLPLADREQPWDSTAAIERVRAFTNSTDEPSDTYRRAFLYYDSENSENFGAYKLPIADVINDRLTAVPRAIFAAAAALQGARGGVNIPDDDRPKIVRHLERYYAKMDMESPFKEADKQYFVAEDVKEMTAREIEDALRKSGAFSRSAAVLLASRLDDHVEEDKNLLTTEDTKSILGAIESIREVISKPHTGQ